MPVDATLAQCGATDTVGYDEPKGCLQRFNGATLSSTGYVSTTMYAVQGYEGFGGGTRHTDGTYFACGDGATASWDPDFYYFVARYDASMSLMSRVMETGQDWSSPANGHSSHCNAIVFFGNSVFIAGQARSTGFGDTGDQLTPYVVKYDLQLQTRAWRWRMQLPAPTSLSDVQSIFTVNDTETSRCKIYLSAAKQGVAWLGRLDCETGALDWETEVPNVQDATLTAADHPVWFLAFGTFANVGLQALAFNKSSGALLFTTLLDAAVPSPPLQGRGTAFDMATRSIYLLRTNATVFEVLRLGFCGAGEIVGAGGTCTPHPATVASVASAASAATAASQAASTASAASAASEAVYASVQSASSAKSVSIAVAESSRLANAPRDNGSSPGAAIGAAIGGVLAVIVVVVAVVLFRRRRRAGKEGDRFVELATRSAVSMQDKPSTLSATDDSEMYARVACPRPSVADSPIEEVSNVSIAAERIYDTSSPHSRSIRNALVLGAELGKGAFGVVRAGLLAHTSVPPAAAQLVNPKHPGLQVAVKVLKEGADGKSRRDFVAEARMMSQFDNPCVVRAVAALLEAEPNMLVLEFIPYGDLRGLLVKSNETGMPWTLAESFHVLAQIADGMAYLESIRFVHRDLAARNCLVGAGLSVKISDFGLSRELGDEKNYYRVETKGQLPIKWMAIESILFRKFSSQSDVWSFGVVAWEVFSYGQVPYGAKRGPDLLVFLESGRRLEQPATCPADVFSTMTKCWDAEPAQRPRFTELSAFFVSQRQDGSVRDIGQMLM
ncbi:syk-prov protein, variant [Capsaspora owczarzaki ATCC 30864]|uniref:TKL protein kinase n=2 Tax=Capsaspora owczarzaki (strain ATCC 30864) TaxID=595528 RepID=E9CJQ2_CAPO3|nr:syk-prov protein [Capsaspora owczarzaki ATCC 30864]XP_011270950.1 syk-prov protein, variant [Capsaspora owczarzaki ATCC 30864]KJE98388.1 TKL protein kinase [Capsaspora owczarzaki ATCC 30864]KJE98389.1 TKL protein kinase, variant 1 [Capsaspora owczarzaki ATCC 30864]KJE98390.1 TKL protein kinase, variant 2 [Capsaspora owczarzaki ATCC 30864]|eukprot:XP_004340834.2 syk-prov protein [Capsaspora owczarzaki ATCC 30864]